jgi:hypothetical protein
MQTCVHIVVEYATFISSYNIKAIIYLCTVHNKREWFCPCPHNPRLLFFCEPHKTRLCLLHHYKIMAFACMTVCPGWMHGE